MSAVTVELPDALYGKANLAVFESDVCDVEAVRGECLVSMLLSPPEADNLNPDEARSLAAALLAAADASEVQG